MLKGGRKLAISGALKAKTPRNAFMLLWPIVRLHIHQGIF